MKRNIKAKKNEIIIVSQWENRKVSVPLPKLSKGSVWFNTRFEDRGRLCDTRVVSPSQFVTISQTTFNEICKVCTVKQLKAISDVLGDNQKAMVFRDIINQHLDIREIQKQARRSRRKFST